MKIFLLILLIAAAPLAQAQAQSQTVNKDNDDSWKTLEASEAMKAPDLTEPNPVKWVISPLSIERRMEASTNPVLEAREPLNVALGLRMFRHLVSLEYSRFSESSGNETYHVERKFQDLLGWYRYSFYKQHQFRAILGGGLGVYQEQVTTSFYNIKQDLGSRNKWTAATGLGLEFEPFKYLVLFVEARLISGQNLDPNPNPDILARISVQF